MLTLSQNLALSFFFVIAVCYNFWQLFLKTHCHFFCRYQKSEIAVSNTLLCWKQLAGSICEYQINRSSHRRCSVTKGVFRNFKNFYLHWLLLDQYMSDSHDFCSVLIFNQISRLLREQKSSIALSLIGTLKPPLNTKLL